MSSIECDTISHLLVDYCCIIFLDNNHVHVFDKNFDEQEKIAIQNFQGVNKCITIWLM